MSIARSSFKFAFGTLLSRLTGLLREIVIAATFGASSYLDAFLVANRIPNLFRDMLAEGALGSAFTKVFTTLYEDSPKRALKLFSDFIKLGIVLTLILTVLGIIGAPFFVKLLTILTSETQKGEIFFLNATNITKVVFPFLGIAMLNAIVMGVLYQQGKFFISAISSSALNIGYILGASILVYIFLNIFPQSMDINFANRSVLALAVGVILGGILQIFIQVIFIWKSIIKKCKWDVNIISAWSDDLKHVMVLMFPAAIASSAGTINILINTNFATMLEEGAVSWLNYSFHLIQLPVGLFGVAIGSVAIPSLTKALAATGQKIDSHVSQEFQNAIELVLWFMVPSFCFFIISSKDVVVFLYQHGKFNAVSAHKTAQALFAYSFCIIPYGLIKVLTSFYYAVERTSYAMKVSLIGVGINLISNILLVKTYGHVGLAATTSITLSINALMLILGLRQHHILINYYKLIKNILLLTLGLIIYVSLSSIIVSITHRYILKLFISTQETLYTKVYSFINLSINASLLLIIFIFLAILNFNKNFLNKRTK